MIKAVIFDLDGLLVDSEPVWFQVRTEMFRRFGLRWTDEDQKALMGRSTEAWIVYVGEKLSGRLTREEIVKETLDGMVGYYRAGTVRVMPGAQAALEYCAARYTVGLASGSPHVLIDAALEVNRWRGFFSKVLSSDEVAHGKPAPDAYREIMKRLNVASYESVVVEDSGSGILAGKAAGTSVVAIPNEHLMPSLDALKAADIVIDSLESIANALQELSEHQAAISHTRR
ncbi:MAG TPA: HAD family phosphatase [Bacteroidota bacterium]